MSLTSVFLKVENELAERRERHLQLADDNPELEALSMPQPDSGETRVDTGAILRSEGFSV